MGVTYVGACAEVLSQEALVLSLMPRCSGDELPCIAGYTPDGVGGAVHAPVFWLLTDRYCANRRSVTRHPRPATAGANERAAGIGFRNFVNDRLRLLLRWGAPWQHHTVASIRRRHPRASV